MASRNNKRQFSILLLLPPPPPPPLLLPLPPPLLPPLLLLPPREEHQQHPLHRHPETRDRQVSCQGARRTTWGAWPGVPWTSLPAWLPSRPAAALLLRPPSRLRTAAFCPHMSWCQSYARTWNTYGFWVGISPSRPQDPVPSL